ncbi:MAG: hypothetical protein N2557_05160 [Hydrogenophilus sp.]|nr:hypothetical protein [Hydrogenophilus sp.]
MTSSVDPFSLFKTYLGQSGVPPLAGITFPTLDLSEIDRRIAELRTVESWLQSNLAGIQAIRQALELQRATLVAWEQIGKNTEAAAAAAETTAKEQIPQLAAASFSLWQSWLQALQNQAQQALSPLSSSPSPSPSPSPPSDSLPSSSATPSPAANATASRRSSTRKSMK